MFIALITGIALALLIIWRFRNARLERMSWPYPLLLASFPAYYWAFALYAKDMDALVSEVWVGVLFIATALLAVALRRRWALMLVAAGCFAHALYDASHNILFVNAGMPSWWPVFCGSIDVILGLYLMYLAVIFPQHMRGGAVKLATLVQGKRKS